ncbi:Lysine acetyltransferase [Trichoderma ghanense]|uniref:Lysine acetyltransferase n=1 Tax=Trichoderma ghanense TaxID=65468 RepID=A0ABY2GY77_9HYPO
MSASASLPPSTSPTITLTNPTPQERTRTWLYNQTEWGNSLTVPAYLEREEYLLSIPLARNGGITNWILTDSASPLQDGGERPVLAACETLRKRALVRDPAAADGAVRDVWAYGVASVFTNKAFRGRGYAGKMMELLRGYMAGQHRETGEPAFSVLFSDIGKQFYAKHGWIPLENTQIEYRVRENPPEPDPSSNVTLLGEEHLAQLAERDEELLRKEIAKPNSADPSKVRVAVIPDLDALQWHFYRESFICNAAFGRKPSVHGALYTSPSTGSRVWAWFERNHYGGPEKPEKNLLSFLRFVIEDESISDAELSEAVVGIFRVAEKEAKDWKCSKVEIWNPNARVRKVAEAATEFQTTFVVRQDKNLASLNWFGEGSTEDLDWVANERFEWC